MGRMPNASGVTHEYSYLVSSEHGLIQKRNETPETTNPFVISIYGDEGLLFGVKPDGRAEAPDAEEAARVFYDALHAHGVTLKRDLDSVMQQNAELRGALDRLLTAVRERAVATPASRSRAKPAAKKAIKKKPARKR